MVKNDYIAFDNGFYPNDWQEDSLGKLCDYVDYRGATPAKKARGIFLITAKNIKKGYIDYSISQEYVAANDYESTMHRGLPKLGDVLITTEAPVGNVAQVDKEKVALAQRIIKYCAHECVVNNTFLKYMLLSYNFQKKLESASTGGTVQGIKGSLLHNLKIAYPKIEEQTAIATALSDTDALIDSLEKLIAKKQAIKQGTMQELLTGRRRLKGFSGEWDAVKFSDVCCIKANMVNPRLPEYAYYPHIGNESIEKHTGKLLSYHLVKDDNLVSGKYFFHDTDVLYGKINPQFGKATYPQITGLCSADMYPISCGAKIRPQFLLNILLSEDFLRYSISQSMRSGMPKINREEIAEYCFLLPDYDEQQAIAQILTDMDDEISALQKKLDKLRRIKQGMMAELLTGRIRLI